MSRVGLRRHRFRLERDAGTARDAYGKPVGDWQLVAEAKGSYEPLGSREFWQARQANSQVVARVRLPYSSSTAGLDSSWRLVGPDGEVYQIGGPPRLDRTRRREWVLEVVESPAGPEGLADDGGESLLDPDGEPLEAP